MTQTDTMGKENLAVILQRNLEEIVRFESLRIIAYVDKLNPDIYFNYPLASVNITIYLYYHGIKR